MDMLQITPEQIQEAITKAAKYQLSLLDHSRYEDRPPELFYRAVKNATKEFLEQHKDEFLRLLAKE